jgi:hypothetical protein
MGNPKANLTTSSLASLAVLDAPKTQGIKGN